MTPIGSIYVMHGPPALCSAHSISCLGKILTLSVGVLTTTKDENPTGPGLMSKASLREQTYKHHDKLVKQTKNLSSLTLKEKKALLHELEAVEILLRHL